MQNKKYTILFADDDKQQLSRFMNYFAQYEPNFRLLTALNGAIACKIAEIEKPDVIVLDWNMPEMDGLEALDFLRNLEITSRIPIVMATALSHPDDIEVAFQHGADDYLKKPYHEIEMVVRVKNLLKHRDEVAMLKKMIAAGRA